MPFGIFLHLLYHWVFQWSLFYLCLLLGHRSDFELNYLFHNIYTYILSIFDSDSPILNHVNNSQDSFAVFIISEYVLVL